MRRRRGLRPDPAADAAPDAAAHTSAEPPPDPAAVGQPVAAPDAGAEPPTYAAA